MFDGFFLSPPCCSHLIQIRLFTGGRDCTIREWETGHSNGSHSNGFHCVKRMVHHTDWVNQIALLPGHVFSCSSDGLCKLWSLPLGQVLKDFQFHSDYVKAIAVQSSSPSATILAASAGLDGKIFVFDLKPHMEGKDVEPLAQSIQVGKTEESLYSLAMSSDGSLLVVGSQPGHLRSYSIETGERLFTSAQAHTKTIRALVLDESGRLLASGAADGVVKLWDLRSSPQRPIQILLPHEAVRGQEPGSIFSLSWDPTRRCSLIAADAKGRSTHVDLRNLHCSLLVQETAPIVSSHVDFPRGLIVNALASGEVKIWKVYQSDTTFGAEGEAELIHSMHSRPGLVKSEVLFNRRQVLTESEDGTRQLWDVLRGQPIQTFGQDLSTSLQDKAASLNTEKTAVPSWFNVDLKNGSFSINLDFPTVFAGEVGELDSGLPGGTALIQPPPDKKEEDAVNLGERLIAAVFSTWAANFKLQQALHKEASVSTTTPSISLPSLGSFTNLPEITPNQTPNLTPRRTPVDTSVDETALADVAASTPSLSTPSTDADHSSPAPTHLPLLSQDASPASKLLPGHLKYFRTPVALNDTVDPPPGSLAPSDSYVPNPVQVAPVKYPDAPVLHHNNQVASQAPSKPRSKWWSFGQDASLPPPTTSVKSPTPSSLFSSIGSIFGNGSDTYSSEDEKKKKKYKEDPIRKKLPLADLVSPQVPGSTVVSVQEFDQHGHCYRTIVRKGCSDFDGAESFIPSWVHHALIEREIYSDTPFRVPLFLQCEDDLLPGKGAKKRFLAPRLYRVERVARWVVEHYDLVLPNLVPDPNDPSVGFPFPGQTILAGVPVGDSLASPGQYIQLICRGQVIPRHWTLATVKTFVWKSGADLVMNYRVHPIYHSTRLNPADTKT